MPEVTTLPGFREDDFSMGFETAWRLSFTLQGVRADDIPLDTDLIWTYTINGVVRLTGFLRTLEEQLSPEDDYQRYELTDRFDDLQKEAFLRTIEGFQTARFTFNNENTGNTEAQIGAAINIIAAASAIAPTVEWVDGVPTDLVERNIQCEGRSIGEFITAVMKFRPSLRWYYNSATNAIRIRDINVVTAKSVFLSKLYGKWHLRAPNFNNVVRLDFRVDKTDCYEKVRLEGLGSFEYQQEVALAPAWLSDCVEDTFKVQCQSQVEPYFPCGINGTPPDGNFTCVQKCPYFACLYKMPANFVPSQFSFTFDGKLSGSGSNDILIEANVPSRNKGLCKRKDDYPGGIIPVGTPTCDPQPPNERWGWTDFRWIELARVNPYLPINACGERTVSFCPKRMFSMLPFWSPAGPQHHDEYPTDPKIEVWELRASFWSKVAGLVAQASGGCPNGRVYQRYNIDWLKVKVGNTIVRDDGTYMLSLASQILEQVGYPKVSGTIEIHLHPRNTAGGAEAYNRPDVVPYIDYLGIEIGDSINIDYEATGGGELVAGPGVLPDADGPGVDLTWANMNLRVMSMSFNRINQSLVLQVANSAYIFGDRGIENLQR